MTIQSLFRNLGKAILSQFIDVFAQIGARWLATLVMQRVTGAVTALGQVASNAAVAGSAAYASTAAIPIVGPALAPAAGAAAYVGAMAYAPLASAAKGYDIPAGVNPLTQLHQREMVLPAKYADTIRGLAEGGGAGGDVQVSIKAARLPGNFFAVHQDDLVRALKQARGRFAF